MLAAVPVDLSRFGLPLGFTTKSIRVGGNIATGSCEFDLTMAGVPIGSPMCVSDGDCNDGNPCTNDTCSAGSCSYTPSSAPGCVPVCGNALLELDEGCDDGNAMAGDGCSAACVIESGYECTTQAMPCMDIDECAMGTDNCDMNAICTNTPGHFDCACNMGYYGDGVACANAEMDSSSAKSDATMATRPRAMDAI